MNKRASLPVSLGSALVLAALAGCQSAPVAPVVRVAPDRPSTLDDLELRVVVGSDQLDNSEIAFYNIRWLVDGVEVRDIRNEDTVDSSLTAKGQEWSALVTPVDTRGREGETAQTSAVILNTPPAGDVSISPLQPQPEQELTANATGEDIDEDQITWSFRWFVDGELTEHTSEVLPSGLTNKGEVWMVEATPNDGDDDGRPTTASVVIDNTAPVVVSITIQPTEAYGNTDLTAVPEGFDEEGDTIIWSYRWFRNGEEIEGEESEVLGADNFAKADAIEVEATPNDGFTDGFPQRSLAVHILNTAPSFESASIEPEVAYTTTTLSCIGSGFEDLDGDPEGYVHTWFVNGVEISTDPTPAVELYAKGDSVLCELTAFDGEDTGNTESSEPIIVLNTAPTLDAVAISHEEPTVQDVLSAELDGVFDADGDVVEFAYRWFTVDDETGDEIDLSDEPELTSTDFEKGMTLWVEVTPSDDEEPGMPVVSEPVTILNAAPEIDSLELAPAPDEAFAFVDVVASVESSDADGDEVTLDFVWSVNGEPIEDLEGDTLDSDFFVKGDVVQVTVTPTDDETDGEPATASLTILNSEPTIEGATIAPDALFADTSVTCFPFGWFDADDDEEYYRYRWLVGDEVVGNTSVLQGDVVERGIDIVCEITPFDGEAHGEARVSAPIQRSNTPPVLAGVSLSTLTPQEGDTIDVILGDLFDDDGDDISLSYAWFVGDATDPVHDGEQLSSDDFVKGQDIYVVVTPSDGFDDGAPVMSDIARVQNTAPTVESAFISPEPAYTDSMLQCVGVGFDDADGDDEGYLYAWFVNGEERSTAASLPTDQFSKRDSVHCELTAFDGEDEGNTVVADTIEIQNSLPTIEMVAIDNPEPTVRDTLGVDIVGVFDADEDDVSLAYRWYTLDDVTGEELTLGTEAELPGSDFDKGMIVWVEVTPSDEDGPGIAMVSEPVEVLNAAPQIDEISVAPDPAFTLTDLVATVDASDPDGDDVEIDFAWYVNGAFVDAALGDTLTADNFVKGDVITLTAIPSDGDLDGEAVEFGPVSIQNTAPSIAGVNIEPGELFADSSVNCVPFGWSDDDGDEEFYRYRWLLDGAEVGNTSVLHGSVVPRDVNLVCEATPFDGDDLGEPRVSPAIQRSNTPPVLASATLTNTSPQEGDVLEVTLGAATDADGDGVSFSYAWYVSGSMVHTGETLDSSLFAKGDDIFVIVTPNDTFDDGAPVTSNIARAINTPPTFTGAAVQPAVVYTDTPVECVGFGFDDADGDPEGYRYTWFVDGVDQVFDGPFLPVDRFEKGQSISCELIAFDGEELGNSHAADPVQVLDSLPTIGEVEIDLERPTVLDTLTAVVSDVFDADGDEVTLFYRWYWIDSETDEEIDLGDNDILELGSSDRGRTIYLEVTPSDDPDDESRFGATVSAEPVTVLTTIPEVVLLEIQPDPAFTFDNLIAVIEIDDDADDVELTYEWRVNGVLIPGADGPDLGFENFVKGDEVLLSVTTSDGTTGERVVSESIIIQNSLPVVEELTIEGDAGDGTFTVDSTLSCAVGEFSDADGDDVEFFYRWYAGSDVVSTSMMLPGGAVDRGVPVTCDVRPNDGESFGSAVVAGPVERVNVPPVLDSVMLSNLNPREGDTIDVILGDLFDADGDGVSVEYEWFVNGSSEGLPTGSSLSSEHFAKGDSVFVRVHYNDGFLATALTRDSDMATVGNTAPVMEAVSIAPLAPYTTDGVVATASATDADAADAASLNFTYTWLVDGDVAQVDENVGATATLSASAFRKNQTIQVLVHANDGTDDSAALRNAVDARSINTAPSIASASITPSTGIVMGTELTCNTSGWADPDNADDASVDVEQYEYQWHVNGSVAGVDSTLSSGFERGDMVTCTAIPVDDEGARGDARTSDPVEVQPSVPVVDAAMVEAAGDGGVLDTFWCVVEAEVYDDVEFEYRWLVQDPAGDEMELVDELGDSLANPSEGERLFVRGEELRCVVTPVLFEGSDEIRGDEVESDWLEVLDTPPEILSVSIAPLSGEALAYTTDTIVADVDADDADNPEDVILSYRWLVNGGEVSDAETLTSDLFVKSDVVQLAVTPSENGVDGPEMVSDPLTIQNTLPVVDDLSIEGAEGDGSFTIDSTLTCAVGAYGDADGDDVEFFYRWYAGSDVVGTSMMLAGGAVDRGVPVTCDVRPNDGEAFGSAVVAGPVERVNVPPVLDSVLLSNLSPREGETIDAILGDLFDADGDDVTVAYEWFVNGSSDGLPTGSSLSSEHFAKGDSVFVRVHYNDGFLATALTRDSDMATVGNTAPVMEAVSIAPLSPFTTDEVVATASATDADTDDVLNFTYTWMVDGDVVQVDENVGATATLSASAFRKNQTIQVLVHANDGTDDSAALRNAVDARSINTAPSIASASITPSTGIVMGTELTCNTSGWADPDNADDASVDVEQYEYQWHVNGSVAGVDSTLSSGFERGDMVTCTATPVDDEGARGDARISDPVEVQPSVPVVDSAMVVAAGDGGVLDTFFCEVEAEVYDDVEFEYRWLVRISEVEDIELDGEVDESLSNPEGERLFVRGEELRCAVTPVLFEGSDEIRGVEVESDWLEVDDTPPEILSVSIAPLSGEAVAFTTDTIVADVDADDADNPEDVVLSYRWLVNGAEVSDAEELTSDLFIKGNTVQLAVTPTENGVDGAEMLSNALSIQNTAPVMTGVDLDAADPFRVQDVATCLPAATDADNDVVSFTYRWLQGGVAIDGATSAQLQGDQIDIGDSVVCEATPFDGTDSNDPLESDPITRVNTPPELANVLLSNLSPRSGEEISLSLGAFYDADGHDPAFASFVYEWYRVAEGDDELIQSGGETLTAELSKDDQVYAVVTPHDGFEPGAPVTSAVATVANTAPTMVSVSLSTVAPVTTDSVVASALASDADGDDLNYVFTWHVGSGEPIVDAEPVLQDGLWQSTLDSDGFVKNQDIVVLAQATEAEEGGASTATLSATARSINSAPAFGSEGSVEISYEGDIILAGTELTCAATGSEDPDRDVDAGVDLEQYEYLWLINGVSTGDTSQMISSGFDGGDQVGCVATPIDDDGARGSSIASAPVSVGNTAPTIDLVTVEPFDPFAEDGEEPDLIGGVLDTFRCKADNIQDMDGDPVSLRYVWTVTRGDDEVFANSEDVELTLGEGESFLDGVYDELELTFITEVDGEEPEEFELLRDDVITCKVTPSDEFGVGDDVEGDFTVQNTAPSIVEAPSISWPGEDGLKTTHDLTCSVNVDSWEDPDEGDSKIYRFSWEIRRGGEWSVVEFDGSDYDEVDATMFADGSWVESTLEQGLTRRDDMIRCSVTPFDGYLDEEESEELGVGEIVEAREDDDEAWPTVGNTLPMIGANDSGDTVVLSETFNTTEDITCTVVGDWIDPDYVPTDPADDQVDAPLYEFAWTLNDAIEPIRTVQQTSSSDVLDSELHTYDKGDVVTCTVTPRNILESGDSVGDDEEVVVVSGTVLNTSPVISNVTVAPAEPRPNPRPDDAIIRAGEALVANVTATDADGDGLTFAYTWRYDDGEQEVILSGSSNTLAVTNANAGRPIVVEVVADDGTPDAGTELPYRSNSLPSTSASSEIRTNAAPIIPIGGATITADPTPAVESTLLASQDSSDPDGDPIAESYEWRVRFPSQAFTTISGETSDELNNPANGPRHFIRGQEVRAVARATDGLLDTNGSSSWLLIENTAPTAGDVQLTSNGNFGIDEGVTCSAERFVGEDAVEGWFDPDIARDSESVGDTLTYTYSWYRVRGGAETLVDTVEDTTSTSVDLDLDTTAIEFEDNDMVRCTVSAQDDTGADALDGAGEAAVIVSEETVYDLRPGLTVLTSSVSLFTLDDAEITVEGVEQFVGQSIEFYFNWRVNPEEGWDDGLSHGETQEGGISSLSSDDFGREDEVCVWVVAVADDRVSDPYVECWDVQNSAPEIVTAVVATADGRDEVPNNLTCSVTATDGDLDSPPVAGELESLTATFSWFHEGVQIGDDIDLDLVDTDGTYGVSHTLNDIDATGTYRCEVDVTDRGPDALSDSSDPHPEVRLQDLRPINLQVDSLTEPLLTGDDAVATASGENPAGDDSDLVFTYNWRVDRPGDDDPDVSAVTGDTLTSGNFRRGDSVCVSVDAEYDGRESVDSSAEVCETVGNTEPTLGDVTLTASADPAEIGTVLTCTTSGSDDDLADDVDDEITFTFSWFRNGEDTAFATGGAPQSFDSNQSSVIDELTITADMLDGATSAEITCEVTLSDDTIDDPIVGERPDAITVSDFRPTISMLELTDPLRTKTLAFATATGENHIPADVEGSDDELEFTYTWTRQVGGEGEFSPIGGDGDSLDLDTQGVNRDDVLCVSVVAEVAGRASEPSDDVCRTVENTAPTAPVAMVDGLTSRVEGDAHAGRPLLCGISEESEDDDGDDLRYEFQWFRLDAGAEPDAEPELVWIDLEDDASKLDSVYPPEGDVCVGEVACLDTLEDEIWTCAAYAVERFDDGTGGPDYGAFSLEDEAATDAILILEALEDVSISRDILTNINGVPEGEVFVFGAKEFLVADLLAVAGVTNGDGVMVVDGVSEFGGTVMVSADDVLTFTPNPDDAERTLSDDTYVDTFTYVVYHELDTDLFGEGVVDVILNRGATWADLETCDATGDEVSIEIDILTDGPFDHNEGATAAEPTVLSVDPPEAQVETVGGSGAFSTVLRLTPEDGMIQQVYWVNVESCDIVSGEGVLWEPFCSEFVWAAGFADDGECPADFFDDATAPEEGDFDDDEDFDEP
ncbi:MAG: hypothetical protein EA397_18040 [Deltaproteobacteria bacterium]|nr:MAG: hypothetical protein EA397_18040 [Deltaproteobacteria bacterium]